MQPDSVADIFDGTCQTNEYRSAMYRGDAPYANDSVPIHNRESSRIIDTYFDISPHCNGVHLLPQGYDKCNDDHAKKIPAPDLSETGKMFFARRLSSNKNHELFQQF